MVVRHLALYTTHYHLDSTLSTFHIVVVALTRLCPSCHQANLTLYALRIIILMPRCLPCMLLSHSHYLVFISHHHLVRLPRYHLVCCLLYYYYYVKTTKMYPLFYHHSICTLSLLHNIITVNPLYLPLLLYQGVCVYTFLPVYPISQMGILIYTRCAFMFLYSRLCPVLCLLLFLSILQFPSKTKMYRLPY